MPAQFKCSHFVFVLLKTIVVLLKTNTGGTWCNRVDPGFWGGMSTLKKIGKFGQVTKNTLRKIEKCGQGDQKYMKKNWKNMVKWPKIHEENWKNMVKWPKIHKEKLEKYGQVTKNT